MNVQLNFVRVGTMGLMKINFKHRIHLKETIITLDGLKQEIKTVVEFGSFWADIKTVQGKEFHTAGQLILENKVRFIMRYVPDVNNSMKIEHKDVLYEIEEILNDNMANKTLTIIAKAIL